MPHDLCGLAAMAVLAAAACSNGATTSAPMRVEHDGGEAMIARTLTIADARRLLWPPNRDVALRPAGDDEKAALAQLIEALWRGVEPEAASRLTALARRAGFALELWEIEGRRSWVIREPDDDRRGAGAYLVRAEPPVGATILLEAPHAYFDVGTGPIAARMFLAGDAPAALRGLFTNTLHRYQQAPGIRERRDDNPADVGHSEVHAFQAATGAAIDGGAAAIVQLHGFEAREDAATAAAGAVVSAGRRDASTPASTRVAAAVATALGVVVLRYPEEIRELGATTNVQGRLANARGVDFVHVELAADVRDRLRDPLACARLAGALATALTAPTTAP